MLIDNLVTLNSQTDIRHYFARFRKVAGYLATLASQEDLTAPGFGLENEIILGHLDRLRSSMDALALKFDLAGRPGQDAADIEDDGTAKLEVDVTGSGLPATIEIRKLVADLDGARNALARLPEETELKRDLVQHILKFQSLPVQEQTALARRAYLEAVLARELFLTQTPVKIVDADDATVVHWAVWDSETNCPQLYLMHVIDSAERPEDSIRGVRVREELNRQCLGSSQSSLKLVTVASNIDEALTHIHPISLKRIWIGPLYIRGFTRHNDTLEKVLTESGGDMHHDWMLSWTVETLVSKGETEVRRGLFGRQVLQVYHVGRNSMVTLEGGISSLNRSVIAPLEVFQGMHGKPTGTLANLTAYAVGDDGEVIQTRI